MNRRMVLKAGFAFAATLFVQRMGLWPAESKEEGRIVKVTKTNDEWKKLLTPNQYHILREEGTEHALRAPTMRTIKRAHISAWPAPCRFFRRSTSSIVAQGGPASGNLSTRRQSKRKLIRRCSCRGRKCIVHGVAGIRDMSLMMVRHPPACGIASTASR